MNLYDYKEEALDKLYNLSNAGYIIWTFDNLNSFATCFSFDTKKFIFKLKEIENINNIKSYILLINDFPIKSDVHTIDNFKFLYDYINDKYQLRILKTFLESIDKI